MIPGEVHARRVKALRMEGTRPRNAPYHGQRLNDEIKRLTCIRDSASGQHRGIDLDQLSGRISLPIRKLLLGSAIIAQLQPVQASDPRHLTWRAVKLALSVAARGRI